MLTKSGIQDRKITRVLPFKEAIWTLGYAWNRARLLLNSYPCSLNLRTAHMPTPATTANPTNQTKNRTGRSKNKEGPSTIPPPIMPIPSNSLSVHHSIMPIVLLPSVAVLTDCTHGFTYGFYSPKGCTPVLRFSSVHSIIPSDNVMKEAYPHGEKETWNTRNSQR